MPPLTGRGWRRPLPVTPQQQSSQQQAGGLPLLQHQLVCLRMYACARVSARAHIHVCVSVHVCARACAHVRLHARTYLRVHV